MPRRLYLDLNGSEGFTRPDGITMISVRMDSRRLRGLMDLSVPLETGQEVACWTDDGDEFGNIDPLLYVATLRPSTQPEGWTFGPWNLEVPDDDVVNASTLGIAVEDRHERVGQYVNPWPEIDRGRALLTEGDWEGADAIFRGIRDRFNALSREEVEPGEQRPLLLEIGLSLWLRGRREEACEAWMTEVEADRQGLLVASGGPPGFHALTLIWWASQFEPVMSWRGVAITALTEIAGTRACIQSTWPGELVRFLVGGSDRGKLLSAASSNAFARSIPGQIAEARFYAAADDGAAADEGAAADDGATAVSSLTHCVQVPDVGWSPEALLARWVLDGMKAKVPHPI